MSNWQSRTSKHIRALKMMMMTHNVISEEKTLMIKKPAAKLTKPWIIFEIVNLQS
jgi:hypothetical protein